MKDQSIFFENTAPYERRSQTDEVLRLFPLDKIPDKLGHYRARDIDVPGWGVVVLDFLSKS